jgi:alkyl sulfatase BDS1-like metallo-beta-lactamase superfamily hydrolase
VAKYLGRDQANVSTILSRLSVRQMGRLLTKAKADFDKGEYRWVSEALKHVVFANPNNSDAKNLLADTYEQLGYQAESGPWRSVYLQGAFELRNSVPKAGGLNTASPDTIRAMTPEMLFEYFAVRLNGPNAAGKKIARNVHCTDLKKQYSLAVENAVLNYFQKPMDKADARITLAKATLDAIQLREKTVEQAMGSGELKIEGRKEAFLGLLDTFPFWFNIVTPWACRKILRVGSDLESGGLYADMLPGKLNDEKRAMSEAGRIKDWFWVSGLRFRVKW